MVLEGTRPAMGGRRRSRRSVLMVDDDPDTAEMYRTGLEAFGFRVQVEGDGFGLFRAIEVELPDIIVLDWQLPGMLGDEILEKVRLDERTRSLPVVMLSNFPAERDGVIDRVFLAGAIAWLEKVKTPPALLAAKLTEALRIETGSEATDGR
jgi:CheY-like chemotaxis protein